MGRVYNFSAGPAVLPEEVLKEAAEEMLDYRGTGMSVMEMSHRSKAFETIIEEAEQDLRDLMNIPDNYTSARTTRSTAPNTKPCQIPRGKRWWLTSLPASFLSRWM